MPTTVGNELGEEIQRRLGDRKASWLAEQVMSKKGLYHDASYYGHAIKRRFRFGAPELRAICEILGIDPYWAFEAAGWPQLSRPTDEGIIPGLRVYLEGLSDGEQEELLGVMPLVLAMREKFVTTGEGETVYEREQNVDRGAGAGEVSPDTRGAAALRRAAAKLRAHQSGS